MTREEQLTELRAKLYQRVLGTAPTYADSKQISVKNLWRGIKKTLRDAFNDDFLNTPFHEINKHVPRPIALGDGKYEIRGGWADGKKSFKRAPEDARIQREDGAWIHFAITVQCDRNDKIADVESYNFEIVFPTEHSLNFLRFDLNPIDHENDLRELRSHLHPSSDDFLLPAPIMTPDEILDLLLRRLRPRNPDKIRQTSAGDT